jgi:hypothetical protein
VESGQRQQEQS